MELPISVAKPRLSELIAAAQRGERVVITKRGEPAVELVASSALFGRLPRWPDAIPAAPRSRYRFASRFTCRTLSPSRAAASRCASRFSTTASITAALSASAIVIVPSCNSHPRIPHHQQHVR